MRTDFQKVGEFHRRMGLALVETGVLLSHPDGPRHLAPDAIAFRDKFMQEELDEFRAAVAAGDEAKAFDALIDLVYVALGTAHLMGFPWPEGFEMVHRANMLKERATSAEDPRSTRGHKFDVVKPEGWKAPDIKSLLRSFGWP